ncbi:MAG: hypothetical protein HY719_00355 [Planctomycetes bacterium]|nr:hypothetical protein [Planctomycetota bacterium]
MTPVTTPRRQEGCVAPLTLEAEDPSQPGFGTTFDGAADTWHVTVKGGRVVTSTKRGFSQGSSLPLPGLYVPADVENRQKFRRLAEDWYANRPSVSSRVRDMCMHDSYQKIIGMGRAALPFVFEELKKGPDHWFPALHYITEENPVPAEDAGILDRMAKAWLEWGARNGYC